MTKNNKNSITKHTETIKLGRVLKTESGQEYPLTLKITFEDLEEPTVRARVYFPDGYISALHKQVEENNNAIMNAPSLLLIDTFMMNNKKKPAIWLGKFFSRPVMSEYNSLSVPYERDAVKGLGRESLCHVLQAWIKWGPKIWPANFPVPNELNVNLLADSQDLKKSGIKRVLMLNAKQSKLVKYYKTLGFRTEGLTTVD